MRRRLASIATVLVLVSLVVACGDDGSGSGTPGIFVARAFIPPPAGANAALYFEVANEGDGPDTLVGVRTGAAESAEVHRTVQGDDGLARMEPVGELEVPAGETVRFEAGGLHVMLLGVSDLSEGDTVEVELEFEITGPVTIDAVVGSLDDAQR